MPIFHAAKQNKNRIRNFADVGITGGGGGGAGVGTIVFNLNMPNTTSSAPTPDPNLVKVTKYIDG